MDSEIKEEVRRFYAGIASKGRASCCGSEVSKAYSIQEIENIPAGARGLALGCGHPVAMAELRPGEVVLDLGSGGGIDIFLAAREVGPYGRALGLDMTEEMVTLARKNAEDLGLPNVEFRLGEMEDMPIEDSSVDVIISNCVINLSPDKDRVFAEAYRVLKPGGRMVISDLVAVAPLPPEVRKSVEAWASCVAGALDPREYLAKIETAGFVQLEAKIDEGSCESFSQGCCEGIKDIDVKAYKPA